MSKFVIALGLTFSLHAAADSCVDQFSMDYVKANFNTLVALAESTSPSLSPQGRMLVAVDALKSETPIDMYNSALEQVPSGLSGQAKMVVLFDGEERAMLAIAAVKYNVPVSNIVDRAELLPVDLSNKVRVLLAISSVRTGVPVNTVLQNAKADDEYVPPSPYQRFGAGRPPLIP